jgi:3-hydroxyisobutyrate dehydrogenase-like beta-hydroxyacid dehydrogenase
MIGFLGLGRMGSRMAARLLEAGNALVVYDVVPAAMAPLVARGAAAGTSVAHVARSAQIVFTSLPGPAEADEVIGGADGIAANAAAGTLVVETSTIGVKQTRALARICGEREIRYLDAPVSGGVASAETGKLAAMVGGRKDDFEAALPHLRTLASNISYLGSHGAGATAKLINQAVYLSYAAVFCEAAAFGAVEGLDVPTLIEVLRASVAGRPLMTGWEGHIASGDFAPGFHIYRALKDLELGAAAYADAGYEAPVFASALRAFHAAAETGYADLDIAALFASKLERTVPT